MSSFLFDPYTLYRFASLIAAALALICCCASGSAAFAQAPAEKDPSVFDDADRKEAVRYLNENRDAFTKALAGLSEEQMNYRPAPDKWSIALVAEHIIVGENTLFGVVTKVVEVPDNDSEGLFRVRDGVIPLAVTNRNQKFTAPPQVQPKGRYAGRDELLKAFSETRAKTTEFVKTTDLNLRAKFAENPVIGTIDAYQWIIFLTAHSERHLAQIAEIKASEGFPRN